MNKDIIQGDWNIIKGKVKEKWGKLTDDDLIEIKGRKDQLAGKLQKRYGYAKDMADKEITNWEKKCCSSHSEEEEMHGHTNKYTLQGDWNIIKGKIKEKWGKLTDDDLTEIKGKREQLVGKLQKHYGYAKDRAEKEISSWEMNGCSSCKK